MKQVNPENAIKNRTSERLLNQNKQKQRKASFFAATLPKPSQNYKPKDPSLPKSMSIPSNTGSQEQFPKYTLPST